jgi:hypothetical protein
MKLIFIYVYIAFLYTWLQLINSNYTVTYLNFLRWLIEASLLSCVLIVTISEYFLGVMDFYEVYYYLYRPAIIIKVALFVLMRYAEIQSNFFLNQFQILLFNTYCYWPPKSNMYEKSIKIEREIISLLY